MSNFETLQTAAKKSWNDLYHGDQPLILVGTASCGRAAGAQGVLETIRSELDSNKISGKVFEVGCLGLCYAEPIVSIQMPGKPMVCYGSVTPEIAKELVNKTIKGNDFLPKYTLGSIGAEVIPDVLELYKTPVLERQIRRVLSRCGFIDPTSLDQYLANDGYSGLTKALKMSQAEVIEIIKASGLRGRGGAGFPTWRKWQFCIDAKGVSSQKLAGNAEGAKRPTAGDEGCEFFAMDGIMSRSPGWARATTSHPEGGRVPPFIEKLPKGDRKYIVCNADEGDPGAFMNRSLLEGDPHALLEGMAIAGYTIGASMGYIYCRAEYPLALERIRHALKQAEDANFMGKNVLGTDFSFKIKVKEGAGAFVCGEETALIASIEGDRGMPRTRPPFPAISGLFGKPTVINNVETLASVGHILQQGAEWFSKYGSAGSKGTKTFALVGKIVNTGLVEVPLGITLNQMVREIGGGVPNGKALKAVQTGGPSGGCIPASLFDTPVDYDSLASVGSIMGSGGMVVMDEDTCMVDVARYFLDFSRKESCGKCVACRVGTLRMLEILTRITDGKGVLTDLDQLEELAQYVKGSSICGLGQTAPNPVLTTLRYFREEYLEHVEQKKCRGSSCKALIRYQVVEEKCKKCHLCSPVCAVEAISGERKEIHKIIQEKCVRCGMCKSVCPFDAIIISSPA